jgi:hypothetical protein
MIVAAAAPPSKIDIPGTATQMAIALKKRSQVALEDAPGKTKPRRSAPTTVTNAPENTAKPSCLQFLVHPTNTPMATAMTTFVHTPTV